MKKKIKLAYMKFTYWADMHLGYWMVNERKFPRYVRDMAKRRIEISKLEDEINSNC
jgi:hypothetical protein